MTIQTTYVGDLRTECRHIQSNSLIYTDAPTDNYGKGENFSPTDLLATAAGTCAITFLAVQCRNDNIDFSGSVIDIVKVMSKSPPRKIEILEMTMRMKISRTITEEEKKNYESIAMNCPVILSLSPDLKKEISFVWS